MSVTNFVVSSLPAYVQENRDLIISNFALSGDSRKYFGLVTGVKYQANLNYLNASVTFQDGASCGFDPLDRLSLNQQTITAAPIKVQGEICPQSLVGKWGEYLVQLNAQEIKKDLPFEGYIVEGITNAIKQNIEFLIWQGATSNSQPFDGILTQYASLGVILQELIISVDCCADGCSASAPDILGALQEAYTQMDDATASKGVDFFLSPAKYRAFIMQLTRANLFHYAGPANEYPETVLLPGSDARVIKAIGLSGASITIGGTTYSEPIMATFKRNFVYATDMEGNDEVFDIWWSNDNRVFRYEVLFNAGVGMYFPDHVYLINATCTSSADMG